MSNRAAVKNAIKRQLRKFAIFFESVRAREGFFVCELSHSDKPAYVYIRLNKSGFYGGSGVVGADRIDLSQISALQARG